MRCPECGGELETRRGTLRLLDEMAGPLVIANVEYRTCKACGSQQYPPATALRIAESRRRQIEEFIQEMPVAHFVTVGQAASLLGVSKQAFSKNRRIKAGFIYGTALGDRKIYLKASVLRFGRLGDGRFPLWKCSLEDATGTEAEDKEETLCMTGPSPSAEYGKSIVAGESLDPWDRPAIETTRSTSLEAAYA